MYVPKLRVNNETCLIILQFPYLNWDTFGSLMKRSDVIRRRIEKPRTYPMDDDIAKGSSVELKILWQHLDNTSGLPVHLRRSLDQYGYPALANTSARDTDQVLFKSMRYSGAQHLSRIARNQPNTSTWRSNLVDLIHRGREKLKYSKEQTGKVLIVDQLWCWVVDGGKSTTLIYC